MSQEVFSDVFRQSDLERTAVDAMRSLIWLEEQSAKWLDAAPAPQNGAGLESPLGQLGLAFNGRHWSKTVQLWTMGHARAIINEESAEDPPSAGVPANSALGFDVGSPMIDHINQAQPPPAEPHVLTGQSKAKHQHPTKGGCCA